MVPYGGFWWRVLAAIIDGIVLQIAWSVISGVLGFGWMSESYMTDFSGGRAMGASFYQPAGISLVTNWLYYALMESSKFQATVGKLAIGLVVTDLEGKRISFLRATGRYFAKILSAMIMLIKASTYEQPIRIAAALAMARAMGRVLERRRRARVGGSASIGRVLVWRQGDGCPAMRCVVPPRDDLSRC